MKNRRNNCIKVIQLLLILAGLLLLSGCMREADKNQQSESAKEEKLQIGMSFDSFVIERWLRDRDLFDMTARNFGAEVNVQVANGDAHEQISQIQYFIRKNMDVIVVVAADGELLSDVIKEAKEAGIRVISYDRLVRNADTDLYISFDNEMVGTLMGEAMVNALPEGGNILAVYGSPTDYNVAQTQKGFLDVINNSNLNIVYSSYCDNWLAELAFDAVEEGLSSNPQNIVGVMCNNDDLASQAFRALAENRLAGKAVLVGQDADLLACQRIVEGTQTMTVYKQVEILAERAAEFACVMGYEKMLKEKRIAEEDIPEAIAELNVDMSELKTMYDGTYEVPYYSIDPVAVTKENMDETVIADNFHTAEDVYLNIN